MQKEQEKYLSQLPEIISPTQSEEGVVTDNEDKELKYSNCAFCQGIIPKYYGRRNGIVTHCSKICSEMTKMMRNDPHGLRVSNSDTLNKEKISQKHWSFYKEVLRERAAPAFAFSQLTEPVASLEPGMKLESLDINNPVNYCVATVIQVLGHRLKIRYDGFGEESSCDVWFNFQADELYPIGWCASHGYPLQPPTGISSTLSEWKSFLTRTLTGALAAPNDLFKKIENRRPLRCHSYLIGDKVEVIHPKKTSAIVPATVTKSLGPHYFLVTTDALPGMPCYTFYGYADCPGVFPKGWCESKGLELVLPTEGNGDVHMICKPEANTDHGGKRSRICSFKPGAKLEALYGEYVRVATVADVFGGRVVLLAFDGSSDVHFIDKNCTDIYPIGWSENTDSVLFTPHGPVTFVKTVKPVKGKVQSASFATFKDLSELNLAKSFEHLQPVDHVDKILSKKMECKIVDVATSLSSKKNVNAQKFVVWLLNNYEYNTGSEVVVSQLLEEYARQMKAPCSAMGLPVILKLFPGTSSMRKIVNKNSVQYISNLKSSKYDQKGSPIYVKDAVGFLQKCNIPVKMGTEKIVSYMGIGDSFMLPDDQELLFTESKARANSNILVISQQIVDFTLSNFLFYFGDKPCSPPFKEINTIDEFRAMIKLCTMAKPCSGINSEEKNSEFSSLFVRNNESGMLFAQTCNLLVYPNEGNVCSQCSLCEYKTNDSSDHSSPSTIDEECRNSKVDDSSLPSPDIQIFFNQWCYQGSLFDPIKVSKMEPKTPIERPAEVLKCLIEMLISVANSKEKLLEIIEAGFGTRIFNKAKDKVVKKGLFRFNTPKKVARFLIRLTKKLGSCENFLCLEDKDCNKDCQNTFFGGFVKKKKKELAPTKAKSLESTEMIAEVLSPCQGTNGLTPSVAVFNGDTTQLECSSHSNAQIMNTKQLVLQPQGFNLLQLSEGSQVKVPENLPNDSPICYVVLTKENLVLNPIQSNSAPSTPLLSISTSAPLTSSHLSSANQRQNMLSNTAKVTQMMENISKTTLLTDIDEPSKHSSTTISRCEVSNEQSIMKRNNISISQPNLSDQHQLRQLQSSPHSHMHQQRNIMPDMLPPTYQDVVQHNHSRNQYSNHQYIENICHTMEPAEKQMHVHKIHHGNARVKYVMPAQDRHHDNQEGKQFISSHYVDRLDKKVFQGQVHFPQNNQHLVSPSGGNLCSPLHSPPALRPPPSLHSRSMPLHSPPTLLASPDVRPRFDFISSTTSSALYQNIRSLTYMQPEKSYTIAHTNVHLPKFPPNFESCPQGNQGHARSVKFHHVERPLAQKAQFNGNLHLQSLKEPIHQHQQPNQLEKQRMSPTKTRSFLVSDKKNSVAYIPIQTSSKEKFVYVPVNSVNQGQPVVLYKQSNQNKISEQGKQIIIPFNSKEDGRSLKDRIGTPFTTVCIQGIQQANYTVKSHTKTVKNNLQFNNISVKIQASDTPLEQVKKSEVNSVSEHPKTEHHVDMGPDNINPDDLQENAPLSESLVESNENTSNLKLDETDKKKKKRGRPPSTVKTKDDNGTNSKLEVNQESPLADSNNLSNQFLIEAFKKQQEKNNRINFLGDPNSKVPELPTNPELWSPSDVKKFLLATDCNAHAEVLFNEEVDGRSFLLITQEALVEFMGLRLGPALKIASYAAQLRAQLRIQNMNSTDSQNTLFPGPSKIKKARLNETISKLQDKNAMLFKESSSKSFIGRNDLRNQAVVSPFSKKRSAFIEKSESNDSDDFFESCSPTPSIDVSETLLEEKPISFLKSTHISANKNENVSRSEENVGKIAVTVDGNKVSTPSKFVEIVTDIKEEDKRIVDSDMSFMLRKTNNYKDSELPNMLKSSPPLEHFCQSEHFTSTESLS